MKNCLVLGVNGQDGSFLAEILAARGQSVWGLGRQAASRFLSEHASFRYLQCDLKDQVKLEEILASAVPDEIYHVAAVHGPAGFSYEAIWGEVLDVNVKSLHTVLEFSRQQKRDVRIFYASSAKVFGTPLPDRVDLSSPKRHDCLYSVSKLAAENLLDYYRRTYGLHANIAYLFNHESVRRPSGYFLPKVMGILASAIKNRHFRSEIYSLDFYCDWGCAREYMEMAVALLQADSPKDLIFATGKTWYARDFVKEIFQHHGLEYHEYLRETAPKLDSHPYLVDITETLTYLGRAPRRDILEICSDFSIAGSLENSRS